MPSLADVRRVVTEHCILPLGSQVVHEKAPFVKSVMIAGPRGVGKKMLAHAVCTEAGANMFDLSPANIATKYPGKAGLNMLLHMVFKASPLYYQLLYPRSSIRVALQYFFTTFETMDYT